MADPNAPSPLIDQHDRVADTVLGVVLTVISIIGVTLNIGSFVFFALQKAKNPNKIYFKRLYMVITLNDILICIFLFPVIQAAFSPNRGRSIYGVLESPALLFFDKTFCGTWIIIWWTISQLSIFLVGFLSLSRLFVLKYPAKQLHMTWLPLVLPVGFCVVFATPWIVIIASGFQHPVYSQNILSCIIFPLSPEELFSPASKEDLSIAVLTTFLYNLIPTLMFLVIVVSCVLSIRLLQESGRNADALGKKGKQQWEAAKTVVLITAVYILCNIPLKIFVWMYMVDLYKGTRSGFREGMVVYEFIVFWHQDGLKLTAGTPFLKNYITPILQQLSVAVNSTANPVIYLARMKHMRNQVLKMVGLKGLAGNSVGSTSAGSTS